MMIIGYMDMHGIFRESCQEGSEPQGIGLVPAPEGWGHGLQWNGNAWTEIADLAADREGVVVDYWQLRAALDIADATLWPMIEGYARGELVLEGVPPCDPVTRAAILYAPRVPRLSEAIAFLTYLLAWTDEQVDELFRVAASLRS